MLTINTIADYIKAGDYGGYKTIMLQIVILRVSSLLLLILIVKKLFKIVCIKFCIKFYFKITFCNNCIKLEFKQHKVHLFKTHSTTGTA